MGYTKSQLLARLKELQIDFAQYEHPVVLTVEDQAKYIGHLGGGLSKNLFLKDKKQRFYIISALAETKVDLKVWSQRLGLGKGGLRMAPEEALEALLQVPLGCVTPFALINESACYVSLLLDQRFKTLECCFFHPLSNDVSVSLNARDLDKFLRSIGKDPSYVDLEANPIVGKDQPPDLASLVPSDATVLPDPLEKAASLQDHTDHHVTSKNNSPAVTVKPAKLSKNAQNRKEKPTNSEQPLSHMTDPAKFVEEIIDKVSGVVLSEVTEENVKQGGEQLGSVVSHILRKRLSLDLESLATLFKNSAYTEGFHAGTHRRSNHT